MLPDAADKCLLTCAQNVSSCKCPQLPLFFMTLIVRSCTAVANHQHLASMPYAEAITAFSTDMGWDWMGWPGLATPDAAFCATRGMHASSMSVQLRHHDTPWLGSFAAAVEWLAGIGHIHGAPLSTRFPRPLLESALPVWKASVGQTGRMSKLHEEVSRLLWSLGILHTNQHITPDGMFCVDIALQDQQVTLPATCCLQSSYSRVFISFSRQLCSSLFKTAFVNDQIRSKFSQDPTKRSIPGCHILLTVIKTTPLLCVGVSLQHQQAPVSGSMQRLLKHAVACLMRPVHLALGA